MEKLLVKNEKYCYDAKVVSIYDGDTITVEVDLGFNVTTKKKIRFYGVNTYELRGEERDKGLLAKQFVVDRIKDKDIKLYTIRDKTGKYGRYLGIIYYVNMDNEEINLNLELIKNNHGVLYLL